MGAINFLNLSQISGKLKMITLMIADDHQLIIDGVKSTLGNIEDFEFIGEAMNGYQVMEQLDAGLRPDIILMDINMPKLDGLDCTRQVSKKYPDCKVIALSQYDEKRFIKRMLKNGAMGYVLKDAGKDQIEKAIRTVMGGEKFYSEGLSIRLIEQELKDENISYLFPRLTAREREVLSLICKGLTSQEISEKLFISFHTVESHRANLMHKAGVKKTAGLVKWAVENDFIE
ncbi:MAG: DNA-binding response regulator [Bacteroidetes bacterium]|nr:MAG: DNA-binding response regulator [Bacteroidota bacterium]RLD59180.1 MAG: DNA-binding response regulator [Bacteroidota bacterium]RLD80156.1 MAG: DNA-binding response regulator [Bacteroidota bacterium]